MSGCSGALAVIGVGLVLGGCAPSEADYAVSERAQAAPAPQLAATVAFDEPLAGGTEAAVRLRADTEALAARATALRARGAGLSAAPVVDVEDRARLEAAAGHSPGP